jgi:predicted TIM-barrel enzyme
MFPTDTLQRGAQAFLSGHAIASDVAKGEAGLQTVQDFIEENDAITVAVTGAGAAATAYVFIKRRELMLLWGLGVLIGSGVVEKAVQRILEKQGIDQELPVKVEVDESADGGAPAPPSP